MGRHRKKVRQAEMRDTREAARRVAGSQDAVVAYLRTLTPPELAQLLRSVFAGNPPSAGQAECDRSVLFLGIANSTWAAFPEPGKPPVWGDWKTAAVAYQDSDETASSLGAALHRETQCPECQTHLWSNTKLMVCPVCGWH